MERGDKDAMDGGGGSGPTLASLAARISDLERDLERHRSLATKLMERELHLAEWQDRVVDLERTGGEQTYDIMKWVVALSQSPQFSELDLPRYATASFYLSEGAAAERTASALDDFLRAFELQPIGVARYRRGSFWKDLYVKVSGAATSEEGKKRFAKAERALEMQGLDKPQSEISLTQAQTIAALMEATKGESSSAMQLDNVLLLRWEDENGRTHSRSMVLTNDELAAYREGKPGRWSSALIDRPLIDPFDGQTGFSLPGMSKALTSGGKKTSMYFDKLAVDVASPAGLLPAPTRKRSRKKPAS